MTPDQITISAALDIADEFGSYDGEHHKAWVIDQIVRVLAGSPEGYAQWVANHCDGDDGPETYAWPTGIAP